MSWEECEKISRENPILDIDIHCKECEKSSECAKDSVRFFQETFNVSKESVISAFVKSHESFKKQEVSGDMAIPLAFMQWKNIELCCDFTCRCGNYCHIDDSGVYYVHCPKCNTYYELPNHIAPKVVSKPDGSAIHTLMDDDHEKQEKLIFSYVNENGEWVVENNDQR